MKRCIIMLLAVAGCGSSVQETPTEPSTTSPTVEQVSEPAPTAPPTVSNAAAASEIIEGRIIDTGPIGSGDCIQRSYQVEPTSGDPLWLHFERCGGDGELFDALEVGRPYRFTVERGASPNFGDDPMIVGATLLP